MGCRFSLAAVLMGGVLAGAVVDAQQPVMMCHMQETSGVIDDPAKLAAPVKMAGLGNSSIAITAANDEAKAWFTQGLNQLHDFWDYEAARAFEQSVRADPKCAMCYWGLYQAGSFRGTGAAWDGDALRQAAALSKHASKAEKLYIQAAVEGEKATQAERSKQRADAEKKDKAANKDEVKVTEKKDAAKKDSKETKILRKLVAMEPGDVQARIFLAESMRGTDEGHQLLAAVLKEHPDDSAANHYWIHAMEPGEHPELALDSARKLAGLAPASGHMVHMPGHIFYRTGDYETARLSFLNSIQVDEGYMKAQQVTVANDWNYVHNLMYLIADLTEAGRLAEATEISAKLTTARGESGPSLYRGVPRDGLTRLNVELPVMLRSGDWKAATNALERSAPDPALKNLVALRSAMLNYTGGMLALEHGGVKAARQSADALEVYVKAKPEMDPDAMPGMPMSFTAKDAVAKPMHTFMDVASMELTASVLLAEGRGVESNALFTKAAAAEKALGYREPPTYIRPVAETRGDALMRAKRYDEAKTAYEAALKERPNSGYPLFGIAQADAGGKHGAQATADYARLMQVWAKADGDLPQMRAARAWIEGQTVNGQ